jgi:hypothetical protein
MFEHLVTFLTHIQGVAAAIMGDLSLLVVTTYILRRRKDKLAYKFLNRNVDSNRICHALYYCVLITVDCL